MLYRENGQFKTSYRSDQQIFPIAQDRIAIGLILAVAFLVVPAFASDYIFRAILIPFVIMALAALGVNILVGYCGPISLGSGAFMAVGAYGAYNFFVRFPGMPLIPLIYTSQVVNAVMLPLHAIALILLSGNAALMGAAKSSRADLIAGWISVTLILACVGALASSWLGMI